MTSSLHFPVIVFNGPLNLYAKSVSRKCLCCFLAQLSQHQFCVFRSTIILHNYGDLYGPAPIH